MTEGKEFEEAEEETRDRLFSLDEIMSEDEIEEGGSETHECELAINDMEYLIEHGDE